MSNNKTVIIILSFIFILGAIFAYKYYSEHKLHEKKLPVLGNPGHTVGNFSFTNQDNKTITQDDVKDKIRIVEYFFTTCEGICPKMNENMTEVYERYKNDPDVYILSHTVNPENDSPSVLKAYAEKYGADNDHWIFLTGDKKELYDMARFSYLVTTEKAPDATPISEDFIHSNMFVLVDKQNKLRGAYDGTDKEKVTQLIKDIAVLEKEN